MPFPWKKSKGSRISRLVADLQTLPKRRDSLVVETGFPTSLIDLFVKNHDKLRRKSVKSSKKKKQHKESPRDMRRSVPDSPSPNRVAPSDLRDVETTTPPSPPPAARGVEVIDDFGILPEDAGESRDLVCDDARVEDEAGVSGGGAVFLAVLKVFLVVVLAFATKRLAVGITMSAFLLLFLEFLGKYLNFFLRPFDSLIQRVLISTGRRQDLLGCKEIEREDGTDIPSSSDSGMGLESCSSIEEIQTVECNSDPFPQCGEAQTAGLDPQNGAKTLTVKNSDQIVMEKDEEASGLQKRRSAKLKAKMIKRLVPKKLRGSKKERKTPTDDEQELNNGSCCSIYGCRVARSEGPESSMACSSSSSYSKGGGGGGGEDSEIDVAIPSVGIQLQANAEIASGRDEVERLTKGVSKLVKYLILLSIVLAGLVGGRILALGLTIAGSLMLKSVGNRRGVKSVAKVE